jgi:hypothetical protein
VLLLRLALRRRTLAIRRRRLVGRLDLGLDLCLDLGLELGANMLRRRRRRGGLG